MNVENDLQEITPLEALKHDKSVGTFVGIMRIKTHRVFYRKWFGLPFDSRHPRILVK